MPYTVCVMWCTCEAVYVTKCRCSCKLCVGYIMYMYRVNVYTSSSTDHRYKIYTCNANKNKTAIVQSCKFDSYGASLHSLLTTASESDIVSDVFTGSLPCSGKNWKITAKSLNVSRVICQDGTDIKTSNTSHMSVLIQRKLMWRHRRDKRQTIKCNSH